MTAIDITVDGQNVFGPAAASRIVLELPPALFDKGNDFVLTRCAHCKANLRQLDDGRWVDSLEQARCHSGGPGEHEGEPMPPAKVRSVIVEIGELLGVTVNIDGRSFPLKWHIMDGGYHLVESHHQQFDVVSGESA